jgi:hypothetical protein
MRLPEPIERSLEPGREWMPAPRWFGWQRLIPGGGVAPVAALNYDRDIPSYFDTYPQDVPK